MKRRFYCVSEDHSGLGWPIRLSRDGEDVTYVVDPSPTEDALDAHALVGTGFDFPRVTPDEAFGDTADRHAYVLFDCNKLSPLSQKLRKAGWKVFGASTLSARLENDRAFAVGLARKAGLGIPETVECATREDGIAFLDQNLDRAFVFKPNISDERYRTRMPSRHDDVPANREMALFLQHIDELALSEGYILQERVKGGVEANFEIFLDRGTPILAWCCLETKQKSTKDYGTQVGCSSDLGFLVSIDCAGIQKALAPMLPVYQKVNYTGFADVNVILADRQAWFLECCARYGYSAHPNFFSTLALDSFGDLMADWIDGNTDGFIERFRGGFGASVNLHTDCLQRGLPLHLSPIGEDSFFGYDLYREDDQLLLAGYANDIGVLARHGYTPQDAADAVMFQLELEAVAFMNNDVRTDINRKDYAQAPLKRYEALVAMGALEAKRSQVTV